MRAYLLQRYGGPERTELSDLRKPVPRPGQVLIRVRAAGLNPVDYKIREGKLRAINRYRLPVILGNELAGDVELPGAGVSGFSKGDRVYARVAKDRLGAFAEYACVEADLIAMMPHSCSYEQAAGVPLAGLTALQCLLDELGVKPGMKLLITGGAGGVGCFAIPLAKWLGAEVTTTASPRGADLVRELGADAVIDYTSENLGDYARRFDGALDLVGGDLQQVFNSVVSGGQVVSIAAMPEPRTAELDLNKGWQLRTLFWLISYRLRKQAAQAGVHYRYKFMHPSGAELAELTQLIDAGTLPVKIDRSFPFEQIDQAFAYLESGRAKGKVVVKL